MSRAETKQHAESDSSFTPNLTQPAVTAPDLHVTAPPRLPAGQTMLCTLAEGGSLASAHRGVTGTHRQIQTRSVAAPALFLYREVRCPLLLCDVLWFVHSELIASHGSCASGGPELQGLSNGAEQPVLSPRTGRPAPLLSLVKMLVNGQLFQPPQRASTRSGEKEGRRKTSIHKSMLALCPAVPQSLLTVLWQGPQRGKPESPPVAAATKSPWK